MDRAGLSGDDGPTHMVFVRHRLSAPHPKLGAHAAKGRKTNSPTCSGQWRHYNSGPIAVRYREVQEQRAIKSEPKLLEIGKRKVVQHGRDVAIFGLATCFEIAEEAARKLEEIGISVALINRAGSTDDTGTLEFFARAWTWSARSKITFWYKRFSAAR